ncbi:hypothetical protein PMKS-003975 [Pichia membranifaciens]|uniref:Uncharacterized protein n=1 Tax=Pichia membranifaciens TaxID=4926 RepID=A0A1Q2YLU9_9ASCO|nr:hypothetical protein PMKS-003975 [Pichia membranifaciens]
MGRRLGGRKAKTGQRRGWRADNDNERERRQAAAEPGGDVCAGRSRAPAGPSERAGAVPEGEGEQHASPRAVHDGASVPLYAQVDCAGAFRDWLGRPLLLGGGRVGLLLAQLPDPGT